MDHNTGGSLARAGGTASRPKLQQPKPHSHFSFQLHSRHNTCSEGCTSSNHQSKNRSTKCRFRCTVQTQALRFSNQNVDGSEWTALSVSIGGVSRNPAVRDANWKIRVLRFRTSIRSARLFRCIDIAFTVLSGQPRAEYHAAGQTQPSIGTSRYRSLARSHLPCALSRWRLPWALL